MLRASGAAWGPIVEMIREDPASLLSLAPLLDSQDGERLVSYFSAYESILDSEGVTTGLNWVPLIDLMKRISAGDPAGVRWTSSQMASLVDRGVTSEYNPIPAELLDSALQVTARLIEVFATPLTTEPDYGGRVGLNDQLNSTAGKAADAFMRTVWQKLFLTTDQPQLLPPEARERIANALESGWGGLELRHALGEFWYVLGWGEPGWLATYFERIWPLGDDWAATNARRAFLFGFLQARQWSRPMLQALRPMFADVVQDVGREHPLYLDERQLAEPFVKHLVFGWLYELVGFGFDGLLGDFVNVAPDAIRAAFVRQLGSQYRVSDGGDEPDISSTEARRAEYWRQRVEDLKVRLPVSEPSEELNAFFGWLKNSVGTLRESEERLNASIDHLPEWHNADELLEFISSHGEREPLPALRLLLRFANRLTGDQKLYLWGHNAKLNSAIEAVCQGALPSHRSKILQLADRMMRAGLLDLSTKLQDCGSRG